MADNHMLTTTDNPWNPHTHFNEWHTWDTTNGYHTASYLARVANVSIDSSDADFHRAIEDAMAEIVSANPTGIYVMVQAPNEDSNADAIVLGS